MTGVQTCALPIYFAGCCYGIEVTNPALQKFPLSTYLPDENGIWGWHLSTFFYESAWNFAVFAVLMFALYKFKPKQRGCMMAGYLILYGIGRAWIEGLRGDSLYLGSIKVSQFLSILLIVAGIAILLFFHFWERREKDKTHKKIMKILKSKF